MSETEKFIDFLTKIEENKDDYVIYLDNDVISVSRKDGTDVSGGYFQTNPYNILWELLEKRGFYVEEG